MGRINDKKIFKKAKHTSVGREKERKREEKREEIKIRDKEREIKREREREGGERKRGRRGKRTEPEN